MGELNGTATGAKLLNCLELLAQSSAGLSVSEVAAATGLSRPSAGRILETLSASGYISRDREKKYRLGLRVFELGTRVLEALTPAPAARSDLAWLAEALGRDTYLMVIEGSDTMIVEQAVWANGKALTKAAATRTPWQATASGRSIAAFSSHERQSHLLMCAGTDADLADQLRMIRHRGYETQPGSRRPDRTGASAPILDHSGNAVAAIGAYFSPGELDGSARDDAISKLLDAADRISRNLGFSAADTEVAI